ncbi:MAG: disulfide oxidoreductase [Candidatus Latescibacteria bacterium]|nr:disulfide oxidoreductase [Candidatus Latescibacterota bacterium]
MTVAEALELHPDAGAVMASFHLGGCSSCSISEHHVLGPAAESYGVDVDALLTALNSLLDGGAVPAPQPRGAGLLSVDMNV